MHHLTSFPPCSAIFVLEVECGCKVTEVATKILLAMFLYERSLMSTSLSWTSLARAALSTMPYFLVGISVLDIAKQQSEIMCCCCSWQEQSSWLARACLVSICLARVHALTALDICVSGAIQKKHVGALWEKCSLWNTLGKVFCVTVELRRFDTKSKKCVPMGTLSQSVPKGKLYFFMQTWTISCFFACNYNDPM
jgi:hypothetical protein